MDMRLWSVCPLHWYDVHTGSMTWIMWCDKCCLLNQCLCTERGLGLGGRARVTHSQAVLPFLLPLIANALLLGPLCPTLFLGREEETPMCTHERWQPRYRNPEVAPLPNVCAQPAPWMQMEAVHHRWDFRKSVPSR